LWVPSAATATSRSWATLITVPDSGAGITLPAWPFSCRRLTWGGRVELVQDLPGVVADQVDQPDGPQRLAGVVTIQDQPDQAGQYRQVWPAAPPPA
jgi:hypothetical protein